MTFLDFFYKVIGHLKKRINNYHYAKWVKSHDTLTENDVLEYKEEISKIGEKVKFSIIMPVYNPNDNHLINAIESVLDQIYDNWELCIADDHSTKTSTKTILERYSKANHKIKIRYREVNGHISDASNSALDLATGEFVVLFDQDDILPPKALFKVVKYINRYPNGKLFFSNEDKIKDDGKRFDPYIKSGWNKELFYGQNFISHLGVYETELVKKIGGFRKGLEGSQDYDLALRFIEQIHEDAIIHIPEVLYHWRYHSGSVSSSIKNKNYAPKAGVKALNDHFKRMGYNAFATLNNINYYTIKWVEPEKPTSISLIVLSNDISNEWINKINDYTSSIKEILIPKGHNKKCYDARINVKHYKLSKKISASLNIASSKSTGDILIFCNSKILLNQKLINEIVSHLNRKDIGAVGFKIILPNKKINNTGYEITKTKIIPLQRAQYMKQPGYFGKAVLSQDVMALDLNLMATKKTHFFEMNKFDEFYETSFFDFDYCMKLKSNNLRVINISNLFLYSSTSFVSNNKDSLHFYNKWIKNLKE